ncbi:hypothetical protein MMC18_000107 [Xylographa bjoerkii]|nr:hypothetical protein [Xylographa bjoerkii]
MSSSAPMATDYDTIMVDDSNYLVHVCVTAGNHKGWERLFSLPMDTDMIEIHSLLGNSFHRNVFEWRMKSDELLLPITVCGHRHWSSTDMGSMGSGDGTITLGDLAAVVGPSDFAIRAELWIRKQEAEGVEHKAVHELDFIGRANADGKGQILCLSATNLDGDDPKKLNLESERRVLADCLGKDRVQACWSF